MVVVGSGQEKMGTREVERETREKWKKLVSGYVFDSGLREQSRSGG